MLCYLMMVDSGFFALVDARLLLLLSCFRGLILIVDCCVCAVLRSVSLIPKIRGGQASRVLSFVENQVIMFSMYHIIHIQCT